MKSNQDDDDDDVDPALFIKNLDTGEQFSVSNESTIEVMLAQYTPVQPNNNSNKWKNFWDKIQDLNQELWDACEAGDEEKVVALLHDQLEMRKEVEEARVNKSNTQTFIQFDQEFSKLLDVNSKGLDDWTALHHAVNGRHISIVKFLLEAKANASVQTQMKRTPLHIACLRHSLEIVKLLAEQKIDLNCQDSDFNTPLHVAAESGDEDIVDFLLKNGADPTLKNHQQREAFDLCMQPNVRNLLRKYSGSTSTSDSYQRHEIESVILRNSRVDHVERLLQMNIQKMQKQGSGKKEEQIQPTTPLIQKISINGVQGPQNYIFHKLLGKGSFGEVFLATRKSDNAVFAIKTLSKDKVFSKNLTRYAQTEKNVLSVMKHAFIVRLHAAFQSHNKLFMVLDYCPGGDIGNLLSKQIKLSEDNARFYISEIILALEALHKNCIIFRDLKPDNVVIDPKGHARLTDFGLSKEGIYNNITRSFCGSIAYLAPEVLMKRGHSRTVDWYLLGVLLYEMIVGIPPYYNQNREQLFENIKKGSLRIPKSMSEEAKDLIKLLLIRDPAQRLGSRNDAEDIKNHSFFKNVDWQNLDQMHKDGPFVENNSKVKQWLKEELEINLDDGPNPNQRLQDWSFVA